MENKRPIGYITHLRNNSLNKCRFIQSKRNYITMWKNKCNRKNRFPKVFPGKS